jgi:Protein of unknown function (DUF1329)
MKRYTATLLRKLIIYSISTAALLIAYCLPSYSQTEKIDSEAIIKESFYPYQDELPSYPNLKPGMTINKDNVAQFKEILDPASFYTISHGWNEILISNTTPMPLHQNYVNATRENIGTVSLSDKGILLNYRAGRPFPQEPDINDPNAGLKLMWNYQRGFNAGDSEVIYPFYWNFRDMKKGKTERVIKFEFHLMKWLQRVQFDPKPEFENNPSRIYRSTYVKVHEPYDLKNTQLLIHRYEDDYKRDDAWLYLGFQRRVRRLATGQTTDAFLGTDFMIEDFEGYNGRLSDYKWEYKGTKNILTSFYSREEITEFDESKASDTDDGYKFIDFGGKGDCFAKVPWSLRKMYVLEGTPVDESHPLSKRIVFIDAQTSVMGSLVNFDRAGKLWKQFSICKTHSDFHHPLNKGAGVPLEDCASLVDIQAQHCTALQFKSIITTKGNSPSVFSVQNLRKQGR